MTLSSRINIPDHGKGMWKLVVMQGILVMTRPVVHPCHDSKGHLHGLGLLSRANDCCLSAVFMRHRLPTVQRPWQLQWVLFTHVLTNHLPTLCGGGLLISCSTSPKHAHAYTTFWWNHYFSVCMWMACRMYIPSLALPAIRSCYSSSVYIVLQSVLHVRADIMLRSHVHKRQGKYVVW